MTSDGEKRELARQLLTKILIELAPYMSVAVLHALVRHILSSLGLL